MSFQPMFVTSGHHFPSCNGPVMKPLFMAFGSDNYILNILSLFNPLKTKPHNVSEVIVGNNELRILLNSKEHICLRHR